MAKENMKKIVFGTQTEHAIYSVRSTREPRGIHYSMGLRICFFRCICLHQFLRQNRKAKDCF